MQQPGNQKGCADRADNDGERLLSVLQDHTEIHAKTEKYDGRLENIFGCPFDTCFGGIFLFPEKGKDHANQERDHRTANDEKVLQREIAETQNGVETLSMGVTMTVGEYAIVHKLAVFLKKHPSLNLHVRYGNTEQLLKLLDEGKIDFALVEGNYRKEGYEHSTYSTESYIGVCAANHIFQTKSLQNMRDLLQERLLVREKGSGTRNILEQNLQVRGLSIREFKHYVEVENMHTIIELLKQDCGISFMYKIAVEKELEEGGKGNCIAGFLHAA